MSSLVDAIKEKGRALSFSMLGIAPAEPSPQLTAYLRWIKAGMHGTMGYMAREDRVVRRKDLSVIVPNAKSMIVAGLDYYTQKLPDDVRHDKARGRVSNYAWGVDYHDIMLPRLKDLAAFLRQKTGNQIATRAYVDTGAILERSHAHHAGLGFTGKNTMLIHPQRGSFFFLGEIITNAYLPPDEVDLDELPGCGTCTRCLNACPTDAFPEPYVLDARRCISYLTIEHKGVIPPDLRPLMGRWVYGCDICQTVCPWQRFAQPTPLFDQFDPVTLDRAAPPLRDLLTFTEETFAATFNKSPIQRIGRDRLVRNACIAAGNSQLPDLAQSLVSLLADRSPLVRGHASWALGQLNSRHDALTRRLEVEEDPQVRQELRNARSA